MLAALLVDACDRPPAAPPPAAPSAAAAAQELIDRYLEDYFATFPSEATAAGRSDRDRELERLDPEVRGRWLRANLEARAEIDRLLARGGLPAALRIDLELLRRRAERYVFDWQTLREPERNPLFWSEKLAGAVTFLLVRKDRPKDERLGAAVARAALLPALAAEARAALGSGDPASIAPELAALAASQVRAAAEFYRRAFGWSAGRSAELRAALDAAGAAAHPALEDFAGFLERLAGTATGSPRLGEHYAPLLALVTGVEEPPAELLERAEAALEEKRAEAAAFGREVWPRMIGAEAPPRDDAALLRRLFDRIAGHHAASVDAFVAEYRALLLDAEAFVRERGLITLPDPLTVTTDRSPETMSGQMVGGVFPAGPYAPESQTFYFVPTPSVRLNAGQRAAFFRDFNHHFNVMITPHEMVPGHYLQGKVAARLGRPVRSLFGDGPYTEGWGTFCERLMLDLGWGGPADRLAHLKKQLENIARTIVDIRVHTTGMSREQVLALVENEALQQAHFANNMWTRSITTAPQITFYWVGYEQHRALYAAAQASAGERFELRAYLDAMVSLGGAPIAEYRRLVLGAGGDG